MYFKKSFVNISVINRLDYVIWDATLADCKSVETVISNLILINLDRVPLWRRLLSDYNLLSILVGLNIFQWRSAMFSVKRSGFAHGSTKRNKVRWISDPIWSERARELNATKSTELGTFFRCYKYCVASVSQHFCAEMIQSVFVFVSDVFIVKFRVQRTFFRTRIIWQQIVICYVTSNLADSGLWCQTTHQSPPNSNSTGCVMRYLTSILHRVHKFFDDSATWFRLYCWSVYGPSVYCRQIHMPFFNMGRSVVWSPTEEIH